MDISVNMMNIVRRNSAPNSPITKIIETLKHDPKKFYELPKNQEKIEQTDT